jgi:hypothetical protein
MATVKSCKNMQRKKQDSNMICVYRVGLGYIV